MLLERSVPSSWRMQPSCWYLRARSGMLVLSARDGRLLVAAPTPAQSRSRFSRLSQLHSAQLKASAISASCRVAQPPFFATSWSRSSTFSCCTLERVVPATSDRQTLDRWERSGAVASSLSARTGGKSAGGSSSETSCKQERRAGERQWVRARRHPLERWPSRQQGSALPQSCVFLSLLPSLSSATA